MPIAQPPVAADNGPTRRPTLQLVVYQEAADVWVARALQHDLMADARSIGTAIRALVRLVQAHTTAALRHDQIPLATVRAAAQSYWNAFATGTIISLQQLGIPAPEHWTIRLVVAHRRPVDAGDHRPPAWTIAHLHPR